MLSLSVVESRTVPAADESGLRPTIYFTDVASLVMRLKIIPKTLPAAEPAAFDVLNYCAERWRSIWYAHRQHPAPEEVWYSARRDLAKKSAQHDKLLRENRLAVIFDQSLAGKDGQDLCLLLLPRTPEGVSVVYSVDFAGYVLATRGAVPASVFRSNRNLLRIPVWGLSIYGRLRYQEVGKALAPAALPAGEWILLDGKQSGFGVFLRIAGGICMISGGIAWLSLPSATGAAKAMAALVVAAAAALVAAGELFRAKPIWSKRLARWIALVAPVLIIELATAMLTLGIEHDHASSGAPPREAVAGAGLLAAGGLAFWMIVRLWPLSRESRCWLVPPPASAGTRCDEGMT